MGDALVIQCSDTAGFEFKPSLTRGLRTTMQSVVLPLTAGEVDYLCVTGAKSSRRLPYIFCSLSQGLTISEFVRRRISNDMSLSVYSEDVLRNKYQAPTVVRLTRYRVSVLTI